MARALKARAAANSGAGRAGAARAGLVSTYFDTSDHALARRGLALRVRERDGHFVQSVKRPAGPASRGSSAASGKTRSSARGPTRRRPRPAVFSGPTSSDG